MRHQQGASYIAILIAIIGFAFMALKQRVLLVPGLKAASTFNLQ